jgi:hypothetical protein
LTEEQRLRAFEKSAVRAMSVLKRDEIKGKWRKLHNEELRNLYPSLNTFTVIKSRMIRSVWHVTCMGEKRSAYRILLANYEGETTKRTNIDGRIILKWILVKQNGGILWINLAPDLYQ